MKDELYEILGVKRTAGKQDIKNAFRTCAKKYHPDVGGDTEKWLQYQLAYEVLIDHRKRKEYDETGVVPLSINKAQEISKTLNEYLGNALTHQDVDKSLFVEILRDLLNAGKQKLINDIEMIKDKISTIESIIAVKCKKKKTGREVIGAVGGQLVGQMKSDIIKLKIGVEIHDACLKKAESFKGKEDRPARQFNPYGSGRGLGSAFTTHPTA